MGLFRDGTISTLEDLNAQDASVLDVAAAEGVDVTRKMALAQNEIGLELTAWLARPAGYDLTPQPGGGSTDSVVVTPALLLWHAFRTLELVYRDAYNSQLNDRYRGRRDQYHDLAKSAAERLREAGIGIAVNPIAQAKQPVTGVNHRSLRPTSILSFS